MGLISKTKKHVRKQTKALRTIAAAAPVAHRKTVAKVKTEAKQARKATTRTYRRVDDAFGGVLPAGDKLTVHKTATRVIGETGEGLGKAVNKTVGSVTGLGKLGVPIVLGVAGLAGYAYVTR